MMQGPVFFSSGCVASVSVALLLLDTAPQTQVSAFSPWFHGPPATISFASSYPMNRPDGFQLENERLQKQLNEQQQLTAHLNAQLEQMDTDRAALERELLKVATDYVQDATAVCNQFEAIQYHGQYLDQEDPHDVNSIAFRHPFFSNDESISSVDLTNTFCRSESFPQYDPTSSEYSEGTTPSLESCINTYSAEHLQRSTKGLLHKIRTVLVCPFSRSDSYRDKPNKALLLYSNSYANANEAVNHEQSPPTYLVTIDQCSSWA